MVWLVIASAVLAAFSANDRASFRTCAIGAVAFDHLALIDHLPPIEKFHDGRSVGLRHTLTDVCPELLHRLPPWLKLADEDAIAQAQDINTRLPATVFGVGIPAIEKDDCHATVSIGYYCSGLCAADWKMRFVRTKRGWQLEGKPKLLSVS